MFSLYQEILSKNSSGRLRTSTILFGLMILIIDQNAKPKLTPPLIKNLPVSGLKNGVISTIIIIPPFSFWCLNPIVELIKVVSLLPKKSPSISPAK